MTSGEKIRAARKSKGLSQQKLGEMVGISQQAINQIETNKTRPTLDTIRKIAKALQVWTMNLLPDEIETTGDKQILEDLRKETENTQVRTALIQDIHNSIIYLNVDGLGKVLDYITLVKKDPAYLETHPVQWLE